MNDFVGNSMAVLVGRGKSQAQNAVAPVDQSSKGDIFNKYYCLRWPGQCVGYGYAVLIDGLLAVGGIGLVEDLLAVKVVEAEKEYDGVRGERKALVV